ARGVAELAGQAQRLVLALAPGEGDREAVGGQRAHDGAADAAAPARDQRHPRRPAHEARSRMSHAAAPPAASPVRSTRDGAFLPPPAWGAMPASGSGASKPIAGPKGAPSRASNPGASTPPPYSPTTALGARTGGSGTSPQAARRTRA